MPIQKNQFEKYQNINYPHRLIENREEEINKFRLTLPKNFTREDLANLLIPRIEVDGLVIVDGVDKLTINDIFGFQSVLGQTIVQGSLNKITNQTNHFEVKAVEDASVRGLTNQDQGMHVDGIYFHDERFPKLMTLFCSKQSKDGGESLFFDATIAYKKLEKCYPRGVQALLEEDLSMDLEMQGRHINRKVFTKNPDGSIEFFFSPFMKRLIGSPEAEKAYQMILGFSHNRNTQIKLKLKEGQLALCDNTRFLHGRCGFPKDQPRSLSRIWYTGISEYPINLGIKPF
ncbi:MAG: TauD/TfdA family dioxygenase [Candidatus Parcubacteria bacterium]|nr:TauD/TfdA family dioxygenase [Candidatus Paceibacterota bacterium]